MEQYQSRYRALLKFALVLGMIVIIYGAYTRLTDAGLGCPDWPGCYGQLIGVPDDVSESGFERPLEPQKAWNEMIHRYLAGGLGLIILIIFIVSIAYRKRLHQSLKLPTILLVTVIFQAALGMWTVTMLLSPVIVTAHLLGGFATLSFIWLLILNSTRKPDREAAVTRGGLKFWAALGLLLLIGQIFLGGWTSTNYAALACGTDFPSCQSQWWPLADFNSAFRFVHEPGVNYEFGKLESPARTAIQLTHRIGAIIVTVYLLGLFVLLLSQTQQRLRKLGWIMLSFLAVQICLGILNVVLGLPIWAAVAHNLIAALLLLSILAINHRARYAVAADK